MRGRTPGRHPPSRGRAAIAVQKGDPHRGPRLSTTLLDHFLQDRHAAALLDELSAVYAFEQEESGRLALVPRDGGMRVFIYDRSDLGRIAALHRARRDGPEVLRGRPVPRTPDQQERRMAEQEAELARTRLALHEAQADATRWRLRAEAAEARLSEASETMTDPRYVVLKRLIARELHPDRAPEAAVVERVVRDALFRRVWPLVEQIDRKI